MDDLDNIIDSARYQHERKHGKHRVSYAAVLGYVILVFIVFGWLLLGHL